MKPLLFLLISICNTANLFGQQIVKEERNTEHFSSVTISSNINATLKQDSVFRVSIKADTSEIHVITTDVIGDMLFVYVNGNYRWNFTQEKQVYITAPHFKQIISQKGSDVKSKGNINSELLSIKSSDGGDIYIKTNSKTVKVNISGGANIELLGTSTILSANISEGGNLDAEKLIVKDASVMVSGGGTALINTTERLKADARGGDIFYTGSPVEKDIAKYGQNNVRGF